MAFNTVNKGTSDTFINTFLTQPVVQIPKGAQWAIQFESNDFARLLSVIDLAYKNEPISNLWKTRQAANRVLSPSYQNDVGCLFCTGIDLPGEGTNVAAEGSIKTNGYIRSYVGTGREDFNQMKATFLDTNISFVESFLRGWALATANFGLVARNDNKNYRSKLYCYKFGISDKRPFILQRVVFDGICCIHVANEEYNYNPPTGPVLREARFIYHNYSIDLVSDNALL